MSRLLAECGEALYGPRWQSDLARDLGVTYRTIRRWAAGTHATPPGLPADLLLVVQSRAREMDRLIADLHKAVHQSSP